MTQKPMPEMQGLHAQVLEGIRRAVAKALTREEIERQVNGQSLHGTAQIQPAPNGHKH